MDIAIKADKILTIDKDMKIIKEGVVRIQNDTIEYVGADKQMFSKDADLSINGKKKILMPGLINVHTHLPLTLYRGLTDDLPLISWLIDKIGPLESKVTINDKINATYIGALEMINSGITCIADSYDISLVAPVIEAIGIRAVLSSEISDMWFGSVRKEKNLDSEVQKIEQEIKDWHNKDNEMIKCMISPHAPYTCSEDLLVSVYRMAKRLNTGIHIHLAESEEEVNWFRNRYNLSPIEYLNNLDFFSNYILAAHCVHLSKTDISILKNNKVKIAHCPTSNARLGCGVSPIIKMIDEQIPVGLGTDSAPSCGRYDLFNEMKIAILLQNIRHNGACLLKPQEVIKMSTINAAKCLNIESMVGSIEVGKKADIILLDFNQPQFISTNNIYSQIVYSTQASDVDTVIINGKVIKLNKSIISPNLLKIQYSLS